MNPTLSRLDKFFLQLETAQRAMQWALVLDLAADDGSAAANSEPLTVEDLRSRVAERVDRYPVFRLGINSGYRYRPTLNEHHVVDPALRCVSAATVDDRAGFDQLLSSLMAEPLSRDKPSWRVVLVDQQQPRMQRLVLLVHHAMSDGVAGTGYTVLFADGEERQLSQLDRFTRAERYPAPSVSAQQFWPAAKGLVSCWAQAARARRL